MKKEQTSGGKTSAAAWSKHRGAHVLRSASVTFLKHKTAEEEEVKKKQEVKAL